MLNNRDKHFGNYRGRVINDQDPKEAGRVKIYVYGIYDDLPEDVIPWAIYSDPFMGGQTELGGMFVPDQGSDVWVFFEEGNPELPVYFAGAPARPHGPSEARMKGQYPRNKVFKTMTGHVLEFDDSEGETRVRIAHGPSETQKTYAHNGDAEESITGNLIIVVEKDANIVVKGNANERVDGNLFRTVKGNVSEAVEGNFTQFIKGDLKRSSLGRITEVSDGGSEYSTTGNINLSGTRADINKGGGSAVEVVDGEFVYSLEYAYSYSAAKDLVEQAGTNAPFDEPGDQALKDEALASGEFPEEDSENIPGEEVQAEDKEVQRIEDGCPVVEDESQPYNIPLGNGSLTVRDLTLNPVYPHQLRAQRSQSITDLVCNAHHLTLNVIEPLLAQFPELRINSGFRQGNTTSNHQLFCAVDLQSASRPGDMGLLRDILQFCADNIPYHTIIAETSRSWNTWWIHVDYRRDVDPPRKKRQTYVNGSYSNGWNLPA